MSPRTPSGPTSPQGAFDFQVDRPEAEPSPARKPDEPHVFRVTELVRAASRALEARFADVWVEGEISNLSTPRSGHLYFTLKDAEAQLQAVMFRTQAARLRFRLEDGLKVRARGRLSIYDAQGKFQLYVERLEPAGLGALQLAFEQLRRKLEAEGLFDAARKRPLPAWPRRVGLVTSPTGAAVRDVLRVAARRGRTSFLISPCKVQGADAPADIRRALELIAGQRDIDVIVLCRGGGSAEDLAAFNDEALARSLAACPIPTVSAVGHEVDFTITDFVADVRAPTPSAAAELIVPLHDEARFELDEIALRLRRLGQRRIADARQLLDAEIASTASSTSRRIALCRRELATLSERLASLHPRARLADMRTELAGIESRLNRQVRAALERRRTAFFGLAGKLDALSPLGVLERGYAIARRGDGHVLRSSNEVSEGDRLQVRLRRGELDCRVESIKTED